MQWQAHWEKARSTARVIFFGREKGPWGIRKNVFPSRLFRPSPPIN